MRIAPLNPLGTLLQTEHETPGCTLLNPAIEPASGGDGEVGGGVTYCCHSVWWPGLGEASGGDTTGHRSLDRAPDTSCETDSNKKDTLSLSEK